MAACFVQYLLRSVAQAGSSNNAEKHSLAQTIAMDSCLKGTVPEKCIFWGEFLNKSVSRYAFLEMVEALFVSLKFSLC